MSFNNNNTNSNNTNRRRQPDIISIDDDDNDHSKANNNNNKNSKAITNNNNSNNNNNNNNGGRPSASGRRPSGGPPPSPYQHLRTYVEQLKPPRPPAEKIRSECFNQVVERNMKADPENKDIMISKNIISNRRKVFANLSKNDNDNNSSSSQLLLASGTRRQRDGVVDDGTTKIKQQQQPQRYSSSHLLDDEEEPTSLGADDEDDIAISSEAASLMCSLTKLPIRIPARLTCCRHIDCCDLDNWITISSNGRTARTLKGMMLFCPKCKAQGTYTSVVIDCFLLEEIYKIVMHEAEKKMQQSPNFLMRMSSPVNRNSAKIWNTMINPEEYPMSLKFTAGGIVEVIERPKIDRSANGALDLDNIRLSQIELDSRFRVKSEPLSQSQRPLMGDANYDNENEDENDDEEENDDDDGDQNNDRDQDSDATDVGEDEEDGNNNNGQQQQQEEDAAHNSHKNINSGDALLLDDSLPLPFMKGRPFCTDCDDFVNNNNNEDGASLTPTTTFSSFTTKQNEILTCSKCQTSKPALQWTYIWNFSSTSTTSDNNNNNTNNTTTTTHHHPQLTLEHIPREQTTLLTIFDPRVSSALSLFLTGWYNFDYFPGTRKRTVITEVQRDDDDEEEENNKSTSSPKNVGIFVRSFNFDSRFDLDYLCAVLESECRKKGSWAEIRPVPSWITQREHQQYNNNKHDSNHLHQPMMMSSYASSQVQSYNNSHKLNQPTNNNGVNNNNNNRSNNFLMSTTNNNNNNNGCHNNSSNNTNHQIPITQPQQHQHHQQQVSPQQRNINNNNNNNNQQNQHHQPTKIRPGCTPFVPRVKN